MPRQFTVNADTLQTIDVPAEELTPVAEPTTADNIKSLLRWGGNVLGGAFFGPAGTEAVKDAEEHPYMTAATMALPAAAKGVKAGVAAIPTRAKAGQQFQQVMSAVGDKPVDMAKPGEAAFRRSRRRSSSFTGRRTRSIHWNTAQRLPMLS